MSNAVKRRAVNTLSRELSRTGQLPAQTFDELKVVLASKGIDRWNGIPRWAQPVGRALLAHVMSLAADDFVRKPTHAPFGLYDTQTKQPIATLGTPDKSYPIKKALEEAMRHHVWTVAYDWPTIAKLDRSLRLQRLLSLISSTA